MASLCDVDRCRRFLSLGIDDGVYKAIPEKLNKELAPTIVQMINDGKGKDILVEIERSFNEKRFIGKEAMLFSIASCAKSTNTELRQQAYKTFARVCKCPRDLFMFLSFMKSMTESTRGWGRSFKRAINDWYNGQDAKEFVKVATKEISYSGWSHRDVMRLGHIKGTTDGMAVIFKYLVKGLDEVKKDFGKGDLDDTARKVMEYVTAVDTVKHSEDEHQVARLIEQYRLVKDHVPTKLLNSKEIWMSLLNDMTMDSILKNFSKIAGVGLLETTENGCQLVIEKLRNEALLKQENIQPISVMIASRYYEQGKGGKPKWTRNESVVQALDFALESCIKSNVKATNKRFLIAARVGSNKMKLCVRGTQVLSSIIAAATVTMVTARKEDKVQLVYFTNTVTPLPLTTETSIKEICEGLATEIIRADNEPLVREPQEFEDPENVFVGVPPPPCDLSAPIKWATENRKPVDVFLVLFDAREATGQLTPAEALMQYRKEMDIPAAKLIICGLTKGSMRFADPNDRGMLDIAGFNASVPTVIQRFIEEDF